jgi:hypothetical protein
MCTVGKVPVIATGLLVTGDCGLEATGLLVTGACGLEGCTCRQFSLSKDNGLLVGYRL